MSTPVIALQTDKLIRLGLRISDNLRYQLSADELIQDCLRRQEGVLSDSGALVIKTGEFTGRSPKDRYIVSDEVTRSSIDWNEFNQPIEERYFDLVLKRITSYLNGLPELWIRDMHACADPAYRISIRIINETPAMNLFAHNMFLRPSEKELETFRSDWQILAAPGLKLNPLETGTRQPNAVLISFRHRLILLAGTGYTGEIKKAVFTVLNYILPMQRNVLGMHCAANMGKNGDTALFFGLSGTGKTTLSTDPGRKLIGDDEHGWTVHNIFNFEGGCYAKCINLQAAKEPEIFQAIRSGALAENVRFYPRGNDINYSDGSITENTRVSYPLHFIANRTNPSVGGLPKNIFFLTCDALAVLPPISRLTPEQAMYQFISGYTAKVAGTETGISEPKLTFSACFGAPFLPLHPGRYAQMFGEKIREHRSKVWLINTGWTGGPIHQGSRINLSYTRAMITAALAGSLDEVSYERLPVFGLSMPTACPGVPAEMLNPAQTWENKSDYDKQAIELGGLFVKNFEKYQSGVPAAVRAAGPVI
jgi:phosphoenolpyruvate carboxykinase (ATP)